VKQSKRYTVPFGAAACAFIAAVSSFDRFAPSIKSELRFCAMLDPGTSTIITDILELDWQRLLSKVSTKGDLATVLLCGTAGFVGDVLFSMTGFFSPGVYAGFAASAGPGR